MTAETIEKPGSLKDFTEERELDPKTSLDAYTKALVEYRIAHAAELGITVDELRFHYAVN